MNTYDSITDPAIIDDLLAGKVGVLPCDTVYGLVARATDQADVAHLYALKHREHKPGTLIAANIDQLVELGIPRRYLTAVQQFWPGAISAIIPCGQELEYLHQGLNGLAIRIPAGDDLQVVLQKCGPLLTSSANQPGEPQSNNIAEAQAYFGEHVDFYVNGGDLSGHLPSTIVRVVDDALEVVRQGAVTIDE